MRAPTAAMDKATWLAARIDDSSLVMLAYEPESVSEANESSDWSDFLILGKSW